MNKKTLFLVYMALLLAVEAIFCFTPLGSLPLGPGIVATLAHLPALVAALTLGYGAATVMGLALGTFSFIVWNTTLLASPFAFMFTPLAPGGSFWSVVICFVPRLLFPPFAVALFRLLRKIKWGEKQKSLPVSASAGVAALFGSLLHSFLVLGTAYLAFKQISLGSSFFAIVLSATGFNAVLEAVAALVVCAPLVAVLQKTMRKPA